MFEWVVGKILSSAVIGPVINGLLTAQKQKLDAIGTHEAQVEAVATKALILDQREAELNAQVLVAEQGNWFTRWVRPLWAAPFVIWTWKVVVWDICLGLGYTPELKGITAQLCLAISIAFFGGRSAEKVATTVAGVFRK